MKTLALSVLAICTLGVSAAQARISFTCGNRQLTFEQMLVAGSQDDVFAGVISFSAGGKTMNAGPYLAQYPTCVTDGTKHVYMNCGNGSYKFNRLVIAGVELDSSYGLSASATLASTGGTVQLGYLLSSTPCSLFEQ